MPDSNLNTSIAAMRTSILSSLPTATVSELVDLSRASKSLNLGNDNTVETAINSRALALVNAGASQAEVIKISSAVKSVLSPSVLANNIANITTINSSIIPDTDVVYDIGSVSNRFNDLYLDGNTIDLGGQTIKATASGIEVPEITIGTGTNKVKLAATATGELEQTGTDSSGNTAAPVTGSTSSSSSVAVFADLASISGPTVGQSVLVIATNKLYIYIGTGWYMIAEVANENPTAITGANASYSLASDGTATTITAVSTDPEGATITWSHAVTSGALNGTTVTNVGNVFTITPHATQAATFDLTISASDGSTGTATHVSAFTLSFASAIAWQNSPVTWSPMTLSSNQVSWQGTGSVAGLPVTTPYGSATVGNLPYVTLSLGRKYFEFSFERKSGHTGYAAFGLHFTPVWNQPLYTISAYTATHWSANAGLLFKAMNGATSSSSSTPLTNGGYVTLHGKKDDSNASLADYSSGTYDGRSGQNSLELAQGATTDSSGRVRIGVAYDTSTRRMWFSRAGAWDWIAGYSGGYINTTLDPATTNGMSIDSATSGTDLRMYLLGAVGNDTQGHAYFHTGSDINHLPSGFSSH